MFYQNLIKISIFSKKIITFSRCAHLMEKSTFLPKFKFFFLHKIDVFAPKLILTETLVTLPQSLHDIILSLYLEIHSFAQKLTLFCIKCYFFAKRKQSSWHFMNLAMVFPMKFFCWFAFTWGLATNLVWLPGWQLWANSVISWNPKWPPTESWKNQF